MGIVLLNNIRGIKRAYNMANENRSNSSDNNDGNINLSIVK